MGTEPESVDAQKGTMKDIFAGCLKKKEAQVCTLLKSCAFRKEEFQPYCQPCCKYRWKTNIQDHSGYVVDIYVNLLIPASTLLSFPLYKICHIIIGVYFRRLKINHKSHEFILDPDTVANSYSATIRILINPTSRRINSRNRKAACDNSVPSKNGEMVSILNRLLDNFKGQGID
jgi:hypothetical protein